jgi:hypothetical protein
VETEINTNGFPQLEVTRKTGDEPFHLTGTPMDSLLVNFWSWSMSDLVSNTTRGVLAEYIVAHALGLTDRLRIEWDAYDLRTPSGTRIEVKAAGYLQSWHHDKLSAINFNIRPARGWDASTNVLAPNPQRHADIYVFCVLKHKDKATLDPLNLDQWEFYLLRAAVLNEQLGEQRTLSLGRLLKLDPLRVTYGGLAAGIDALSKLTITATGNSARITL